MTEKNMKSAKNYVGLMIVLVIALCAGSATAWDTRWQFKQDTPLQSDRSAISAVEMRKKFDHNSMNRFRGTTNNSSGYTVMRNLNGEIMRGYIQKDGSGLLRDQDGNFHNVNTRW
jgi:hypothetical protein